MPDPASLAAAFSLIEVLISVVVLALGLLGLSAVYPVVIREQRSARDVTLGVSTVNDARSYLSRHTGLNDHYSGWRQWREDLSVNLPNIIEQNGWNIPLVDVATGNVRAPVTGDMIMHIQDAPVASPEPDFTVNIPVKARLFPAPFTPGLEPGYVWDFVARRVSKRDPVSGLLVANESDPVQIALFVRAIDPGIRIPRALGGARPLTLSDVLANNLIPDADRFSPVAVRSDNGRPTRNGRDQLSNRNYSSPITIDLRLAQPFGTPQQRQRLRLRANTRLPNVYTRDVALSLAMQIGQKLVDSQGNIYTVTGVEGNDVVLINPPVPMGVATHADISPVAFVPQIPVTVSVFTIHP